MSGHSDGTLEHAPTAETVLDESSQPMVPGPQEPDGIESLIGTTIEGRYQLRELLGKGGMGAVFIATHLKLGIDVAVKVIRPAVADDDTATERFRREARATAQVDNPHVVQAIDFGKLADGSDFFVLQLVQGPALGEMLLVDEGHPWDWARVVGFQIADALAATHRLGIVHRDLKPDNIIVTERESGMPHIYVLDFGIARDTRTPEHNPEDTNPLTRVGAVLGTPGYMSPQQIAGDPVDAHTDIYSLGVILWECCTGRRLWTGDTLAELVTRQLSQPPPRLDNPEVCPRPVPTAFADLIDRMLLTSPGDRPESGEVVAKLSEMGSLDRSMDVLTTSFSGVPHEGVGIDASLPTLNGTETQERRRPRWLWGAGAGLLVCALLIIAVFGSGSEPVDEQPVGEAPVAQVEVEPISKPVDQGSDAPAFKTIPTALEEPFETVSSDTNDGRRKKAARAIETHEPQDEVPEVLQLVARLQMAENCPHKKTVVEALGKLGDPRGVAAIRRYEPRGFHACGRRDCYACMRKAMADAIRAMGEEPSERTLKVIGEAE